MDVITLSDEEEIIGESNLIAFTGQRFVGTCYMISFVRFLVVTF